MMTNCRRILENLVVGRRLRRDRKGRALTNEDIDHYQEIVFALSRTRALMQKLSALSKEWIG